MINSKGEIIYTSAELAYELGISPATVNACARRMYGNGVIPYWTLNQAQRICEYIKSISIEEDARRLSMLHEMVVSVMGKEFSLNDNDTRKRADKDVHIKKEEK